MRPGWHVSTRLLGLWRSLWPGTLGRGGRRQHGAKTHRRRLPTRQFPLPPIQPQTRLHAMASNTFEGLAPEIVANIVSHAAADIKDLQNIRLANKTLDSHATRELFREAFIRPTEDSVAHWKQIAENAPLAQLARRAVIHTVPDITEDERYAERDITEEVEESYAAAVPELAKFPNLDSLLVAFSAMCLGLGENNYWDDVMEPVGVRVERLQLIFEAIKARQDAGNPKIRSLTLMNLQNQPIPDFTGSALFRDVMSQLDELHVQLVQESNEHGPDHDYTKIELRTFPPHFCSDWLAPIAANLKELSLYSRSENWGPLPGYFDPSAISFPKLETLSLGYYTIAYDNQLDWVLSIKSLKKLVMHRCMIVSHLRIDEENMEEWKPSTRDWKSTETDRDWGECYTYSRTWSQVFQALADGLPNLQEFVFDYPRDEGFPGYPYKRNPRREYSVEVRHDTETRVFPERYVVFDNGILPTHWPEAEKDGQLEWADELFNLHEPNLEEDQKALDDLLEICRSRQ